MEVEVKLRLASSAAHQRLCGVLSPHHCRTHLQENLFFDGRNAELSSNLAVLRLRFYDLDSHCVLSLKSKPQISAGISRIEEQEEPLDPIVGRHCASEPWRLLHIESSDIIKRVKEEFNLGAGEPEEAKDLLEGLLKSNGIEYEYSQVSKFAIFRAGKLPG
ncbi:UNVERIFIED_CONTAM: Triphosphate tunnel metalloenzyme 3 [Sesamum latifolium]|uniref:Triphosphate tunnel metalloenzyme 3 n=1 Tax=Sesamum latifolium TaxID=2727402 RepID=A0AAW2YDR1_9LAMI